MDSSARKRLDAAQIVNHVLGKLAEVEFGDFCRVSHGDRTVFDPHHAANGVLQFGIGELYQAVRRLGKGRRNAQQERKHHRKTHDKRFLHHFFLPQQDQLLAHRREPSLFFPIYHIFAAYGVQAAHILCN